MADSFFCLDLSESYIKIVDASRNGNQFGVNGLGFGPSIPNYYFIETEKIIADQAGIISKLLINLRISQKNVNVIIPDSVSYSQILDMPKLNEKELLSAIKYQADQFIPLPIENTALDIEILSEDKANKKLSVLIVATSQNIISKVEKTVESAGLILQSVENELSAVARFFSDINYSKDLKKASVVVNMGLTTTSLYLLNPNDSLIRQVYNFNVGYELFYKEICQNLNLNENEASALLYEIGFTPNSSYHLENVLSPAFNSFVKHIEKFIIVAQEKLGSRVERIAVINEVVRINGLVDKIRDYFHLTTICFDAYDMIARSNSINYLKPKLPMFIPALGGNL